MDKPDPLTGAILRAPGINRLVRLGARRAIRRGKYITAEIRQAPESVFVPDLFRNLDRNNDGKPDAFGFGIMGGWFSQDFTYIEVAINGRKVPAEQIRIKNHALPEPLELPLRGISEPMPFLPGRPVEIICLDRPMGSGLNLLTVRIIGDLIDVPVPVLPVLIQGGKATIPILDPPFDPGMVYSMDREREVTCHFVPHIHYDLVWLKDRDTLEALGVRNLAETLRIMHSDKEMTFVVDQGPQVESLRRLRPDLFRELASQIGAGRIEPTNGLWAEPDTYVPNLESLVRGSIRWQRYSEKNFGTLSPVAWIIDSFGISPQMPQILVKSGSTALVYSRAKPDADVPSEFLWIGLDGTKILTAHLPKMYMAAYPLMLDPKRGLYQLSRVLSGLRRLAAGNQILVPSGIDHGRPQATQQIFSRWNERHPKSRFIFSTPTRFFKALKGAPMAEVTGEMGPDLTGCYGGRVKTKRLNRTAEACLRQAEFCGVLARFADKNSRSQKLDAAWERTLSYQFHDSIAGPIPDHVAADVDRQFELAVDDAKNVRDSALQDLGRNITTGSEPHQFIVANPLPFPRKEFVQVSLHPQGEEDSLRVLDPDGTVMPHQVLNAHRFADGGTYDLTLGFLADLPPAGYRVYTVGPAKGPAPRVRQPVHASLTEMSGPLLKAVFDPSTGTLSVLGIPDKMRVGLASGASLALQRDLGNLYYGFPLGRLRHERGPYSVRMLENGPLRSRIITEGRIGRGRFVRTYTLTHSLPYIEVDLEVDFADPGKRLIVRLPTDLRRAAWRNEVPGGFMNHARGEHAAVSVSDLTSKKAGISLFNDGAPGHTRSGSELRLTMHRSTDRIHFYRSGGGALGIGVHRARIALMPHDNNFCDSAPWQQAARFLHPPVVLPLKSDQKGNMPKIGSLLSLAPSAILADALYMEGDELVLRCHETAGSKQRAKVNLGFNPKAVRLTDLLGRTTQELAASRKLSFPVGQYEIITLRIKH